MKLLITIISTFFVVQLYAQQLPQYSQYFRNQVMMNPGAYGMYDFTDITLGGRYQWVGFDNSPKTAYGYFSTVLNSKKSRYNPSLRTSNGPFRNPRVSTGKVKHALGGQIVIDEYGAFRQYSFAGVYAIHMPLTRTTNLSFGTKVGISNNSFLQERATVLTQMAGYNGPAMSDPEYDSYIANQSNLNYLDIGAGFYYYGDRFFVGVSSDQLTQDLVSFGSGTADFDPTMHFNFTGGYKFDLNDNVTLMPAVLIKYMKPAPLSIEGSLQFEYQEWLWFGLSYRHTDAVVGMVGCNISERFKFGYSYDFTISRLNQMNSGGHEVILGIMLGR